MAVKKPVGIVAELVSILKTIAADGQMTDERIAQVDAWLAAHPDCSLAPLELLRATSAAIRANGPISKEGSTAFHKAVEQALPPDERRQSKAVRKARELADEAKQKEERTAELATKRAAKEKARADAAAARERNRVLYRSNFLAAGTSHDNRCSAIRSHLKEDQAVVLKREPHNAYDRFAIKIFAQHSGRLYDVGYVPREITSTLAPLMDRPHRLIATCTKILENDRLIPIIDLVLYGPDADFNQAAIEPTAIASGKANLTWAQIEAEVPAKTEGPVDTPPPVLNRAPVAQSQDQRITFRDALLWLGITIAIVLLGIALK
jgi:hypothetical protein